MRRDNYSNMYSWEEQQLKQQRQQLPQWPMKLADAIGTRSGEAWLARPNEPRSRRPSSGGGARRGNWRRPCRCLTGWPHRVLPPHAPLAVMSPFQHDHRAQARAGFPPLSW